MLHVLPGQKPRQIKFSTLRGSFLLPQQHTKANFDASYRPMKETAAINEKAITKKCLLAQRFCLASIEIFS